jgi:predicted enzyme related to lactoylglutathione lyase
MSTRLTSVVIDADDPRELARWWSAALGWPITYEAVDEVVVEPADNGPEGTVGPVPALVFGTVPEPKTVKNRVHLDLASDSLEHQREIVERLLAAGATPLDIGQGDVPWVVLADPAGNELCVLEPRDRHRGRGPLAAIVLDAADPSALAAFWEQASGWPIAARKEYIVSLHNPAGVLPDLELLRVGEPKVVKNRLHLDVAPFAGDDLAEEVRRLEGLGAVRADVGQRDVPWVVLRDPEGNELCVLTPRP